MWKYRLGQLRIEAVDPLDLAADQVVAERDLALEAAGVGEVDSQRIVVVGHGLADVVEQRAGDRDVAIDSGEGRGRGAHSLSHRDRVVEEPVPIRLVVVLGGRRLPEPCPEGRALAEEAVEQLSKLGVLDRLQQLAQIGLQPLHRDARAVGEVGALELVGIAQGGSPRR